MTDKTEVVKKEIPPEVQKKIDEVQRLQALNQKKKHLDWFDYQKRGGRFENKTAEEIREDRKAILDEIKELEKKVSGAQDPD
jgi:hypothetical protein